MCVHVCVPISEPREKEKKNAENQKEATLPRERKKKKENKERIMMAKEPNINPASRRYFNNNSEFVVL